MNFENLASEEEVKETISNLKLRNINAELVDTKEDVLKILKKLIPSGSEIMTSGSTTLQEIGFTDLLKSKNHDWINIKDELLSEKNPEKQNELRKKSVTSKYFIGSIHAVSKDGEILVASASGSQIPSYAFSSDNVIWIVGTQKIVSTHEDLFKRLNEYVFPLENERMKKEGYPGSTIGKILLFEREIMPRKINLIFVNEKLGF
jgi:L-lactate utilization protein LutC